MSLAHSLDHIHRTLTRLWADTSARPGVLTFSEYEYLRAVERLDGAQLATLDKGAVSVDDGHDGHHLQDLVDVLGVRKASASAAIAKLEARGLVERFPCQIDARAQHIVLTDKATAYLREEEEAVYAAAAARIEALLKRKEFDGLESALAKVRDHI